MRLTHSLDRERIAILPCLELECSFGIHIQQFIRVRLHFLLGHDIVVEYRSADCEEQAEMLSRFKSSIRYTSRTFEILGAQLERRKRRDWPRGVPERY